MADQNQNSSTRLNRRIPIFGILVLALIVFIITLVGIRESRSDSYKLMVMQGKAFIESLAYTAENAMTSETFYDYLVHKRYQEVVIELTRQELSSITPEFLSSLATHHDLYAAYVYGIDSLPIAGTVIRGANLRPPEFIYDEVTQLIANPEDNYVLLLDEGDQPDEIVHYYLEISNKLDRVILIVADALYYVEALEQTQIGFLAERMSQESDVEYIIYQSPDEIIFSSVRPEDISLVSDYLFLEEAIKSDTVMNRRLEFQENEILEMVRPLATVEHPNGLLRVGLSLESYKAVSRGYDFQMITLALVLFGLVTAVVLYFNSRTRRKELSREYRRIKSISEKIFDQMKTGVAAVDNSGVIIMANDAFNQICKIKLGDDHKWDDCFNHSFLKFNSLMEKPNSNLEFEIAVDSNESQSLLVAVSKIINESDQNDGLVAVISDVTRLKELEQQTARKERLSEMGNLAAGVAHEIRNPLNTISIASQRLAAEFKPKNDIDEYLSFTKQIKDETKRLNEIITRFLALTRENNKSVEIFELDDLIAEFLKLVAYEADELKIQIETSLSGAAIIKGNPDNIKQVLSNLFNNAKEALDNQPGTIRISSYDEKESKTLTFEDSGPGISEDIHDKIFTPYYTTKEAGTGLGLATVYKIIDELGGEVSIEQSKLGGAKFVIKFP